MESSALSHRPRVIPPHEPAVGRWVVADVEVRRLQALRLRRQRLQARSRGCRPSAACARRGRAACRWRGTSRRARRAPPGTPRPGAAAARRGTTPASSRPSSRAAKVSSATWPSSCSTAALSPSRYSMRKAIGPFVKKSQVGERGKRRQLSRMSPAFREMLRPRACSSSSHDQSPSSPAFHTASPWNAVTAFTPWLA